MSPNTLNTISYLSDVIYVLQRHAYAKASDPMPTCNRAQQLATERPADWHEGQEARSQQAHALVAWAESLSGDTTYEHDLKALLTQDTLPTTRLALALAPAHARGRRPGRA